MNRWTFALILGLSVTALSPAALAVDFVLWHPHASGSALLLAVPRGMTPEQAALAYQAELARTGEFANVFTKTDSSGGDVASVPRYPKLPVGRFEPITADDSSHRTLLIGNTGSDLDATSKRIAAFAQPMLKNGLELIVLPPVGDVHVPDSEIAEFDTKLSELVSMAIDPGGADVDPATYGEAANGARNFNVRRDRSSQRLLRSLAKAHVFLLGICRGSQESAVALGQARLIQDIPSQYAGAIEHDNSWHDISVLETTHNLLRSIVGTDRIHVNSFHHQAVRFDAPVEGAELAARADDGITEAWELRNGRGLFLQFHPEFMDNVLGAKILKGAVEIKNRLWAGACSRVF